MCSDVVSCFDSVVWVVVLLFLMLMRMSCDISFLCNCLIRMCCFVFGECGRNVDRFVVKFVCLIMIVYSSRLVN